MCPGGCGIAIGGCQQAITTRVYLLVHVGDLGHVPGVLEQDDVSGIQADGPVAGVACEKATAVTGRVSHIHQHRWCQRWPYRR